MSGTGPNRTTRTVELGCLLVFLILLCQPGRIPDPFGVGSNWSWPLICYGATFILLLAHLGQQRRWTLTSFDLLLAIYLLAVFATWPTSFDRSNTLRWIVALFGQVGLFWALRTVFADSQLAGRLAITVFIVGIAVVQAQALAFHVSEGLSVRLIGYPLPTGWSGYPELGLLSVVQFALLIATWASLERPALRLVVLLLLFVNLLELVFLYSRMALVTAVVVALVAGVRVVRLRRAWSYIAILLATLLLLTVAVSKNQTALSIVKSTVGFGQVGATPSMRFDIWRRSVRMIRDHALSGVGLGNFQAVYEPHYNPQPNSDGRRGGHAHNLWLHQTAEVGIPGGAACAAMWVAILVIGWRRMSRPGGLPRLESAAAFLGLVAIAIRSLTDNMFFLTGAAPGRLYSLTWVLIALLLGSTTAATHTAGLAGVGTPQSRLRNP